jgi:hypothetical protein
MSAFGGKADMAINSVGALAVRIGTTGHHAYQYLSLRYAGIIHATLSSQSNRDRVMFGVFRVARLHVIGAHRNRYLFTVQQRGECSLCLVRP